MQFQLLWERSTRIRENKATMQAIEEQLNQTRPTLIPSGPQGVDQPNSPVTICIDNAQQPLIIDSGAHCSIVAKDYLDDPFPNWEKQLLPTKANNLESALGKMTSIGTIIKEIIIPHRKGNIRPNPDFVVLEDSHIQGFLLGPDYQRMYGIDMYKCQSRHITIGTNKEKEFSLDIYQMYTHDPLEELLN
ncbi:hypothetical protein O181_036955 [Austropuccinia psidii MF-1]|uniref:Retropepsins domain-containing protein n=1 Tax=Austropuccinia psidii MF-1 TaxID=1389203 RepID=A0A9Q3D9X7_9BASI|nr:hypothetical protein [Austropuccinia psidii MF-1]